MCYLTFNITSCRDLYVLNAFKNDFVVHEIGQNFFICSLKATVDILKIQKNLKKTEIKLTTFFLHICYQSIHKASNENFIIFLCNPLE